MVHRVVRAARRSARTEKVRLLREMEDAGLIEFVATQRRADAGTVYLLRVRGDEQVWELAPSDVEPWAAGFRAGLAVPAGE